jgi:hypothetical protein
VRPRQHSTTQQHHFDSHLINPGRVVVLKAFREVVSVIEDFLDGTGHQPHLRNFGRAAIA